MKLFKRFRFFIISILGVILLYLINREMGVTAVKATGNSFIQMLLIIPPIFLLLGLLDVWVPRDIMVKYLGEGSGIKGILIALFLGSMAAGPLYGAFPVVAVLMKKGAKLFNMIILIGAWSTTKIPMLLFEFSTLGPKFALTRLLIDIPGIVILAFLVTKLISKEDESSIVKNIEKLEQ
jgi:uncharacterized membrane protein YraQ (UPF0718 family)